MHDQLPPSKQVLLWPSGAIVVCAQLSVATCERSLHIKQSGMRLSNYLSQLLQVRPARTVCAQALWGTWACRNRAHTLEQLWLLGKGAQLERPPQCSHVQCVPRADCLFASPARRPLVPSVLPEPDQR